MSGIVEPPVLVTSKINRYTYTLSDLIPHTSVLYFINCFHDDIYVKSTHGILEGEQYKEWTTDDWLDRFIRQKVEELPDVEVKPVLAPEPSELPEHAEPAPEPPEYAEPTFT
jgi:hypothetical protein